MTLHPPQDLDILPVFRDRPDPELLSAIEAHPLDKPNAEYPFSKRLADDNGWPQEFAVRVIQEYRRFVYLACISEHELTPSDEVDQAWHLHLTYTRDYWEEFCPKVLGRALHHDPTQGGEADADRHQSNYERTLKLYRRIFGETPPPDIWPSTAIRFRYSFARVNRGLFAFVPRQPWQVQRDRLVFATLGLFILALILGELTSIGTLFAFVLVSVGVMLLRLRRPDIPRSFRVPGGPYVVPVCGALSSGLLMYTADTYTIIRLFAWMAIGLVVYFMYGRKHSKLRQGARAAGGVSTS